MSTPTIVKAADARDFLSIVPSLAGFTPVESVVLIPFKARRTIGLMRFDLPPRDERDLSGFASTLVGLICRMNDADSLLAVAYSTERNAEDLRPVLFSLVPLAQICGLEIVDLMYVAGDGWGKADTDVPPRPLEELVMDHPEVKPPEQESQHTAATLPAVDEELAIATLMAIGEVPEVLDPGYVLALIESISTGTADAMQLAMLHWALEAPAVRDIVLCGCARSEVAEDAMRVQFGWDPGSDNTAAVVMTITGQGRRPDAHRLKQALANVRTLAAMFPLPGIFAAAGWLAWALGKSTEACAYIEQGLAIDEDHGLCGIVSTMLLRGQLPDWAFSRAE